jgi:Flp pilus assembly protein TadD
MATAAVHERAAATDKAQAIYRDIVGRVPGFAPAARNLAGILADQRRSLDEAFKLAMKARDVMPADPGAAAVLGRIVYARGENEWAIRLLEESSAAMGTDARVRFYLGMARLKSGNRDGARRDLQAALNLKADFPEAEEARKALAGMAK